MITPANFTRFKKVDTPEGRGILIGMMFDRQHALVAIKVKASDLDDETLGRYCARFNEMSAKEKEAYKKKAVYNANREYPLDQISYV